MPFFQQLMTSEKIVFCAYICVAALTFIGLVIFGIILSKISSDKFRKSCKAISDFANESGVINDANLEQFEATCFNENTSTSFLEGWEAFKAARFGYPSEYVDNDKVLQIFDAKKFKLGVLITSLVLFFIAVVISVATIVTVKDVPYIVVYAVLAMLLPLILLPCYLPAKPRKKAYVAFSQTMDDLDTAVQLQNYVERKVDNRRLNDIQRIIADVIVAEQNKPIPSKVSQLERQKAAELAVAEEESIDDVRAELFADDEPVEYVAEETVPVAEEAEPVVEAEPIDEAEVPVEEAEVIEEPVAVEEPAPKKVIKFEPFVAVLNQVVETDYPTATLKKVANILVLAFGKFKEPEQREALKNSIRRLIVSYKASAAREAEEAAAELATEEATADTYVEEAPEAEYVPAEEIEETPEAEYVPTEETEDVSATYDVVAEEIPYEVEAVDAPVVELSDEERDALEAELEFDEEETAMPEPQGAVDDIDERNSEIVAMGGEPLEYDSEE